MELQVRMTSDGSPTLFRPDLEEHYHSLHGARTESQHVFIEHGLNMVHQPVVRILEVGLGTGLNALLTLHAAHQHHQEVEYFGVEAHPLNPELTEQLALPQYLGLPQWNEAYRRMHTAPHGATILMAPHARLTRYLCDLRAVALPTVDVVYMDAFAPDKQPELWDSTVFRILYDCLSPGGLLTTYSAKGSVRRTMQAVGFDVKKLPGPPGKRQMLQALKPTSHNPVTLCPFTTFTD